MGTGSYSTWKHCISKAQIDASYVRKAYEHVRISTLAGVFFCWMQYAKASLQLQTKLHQVLMKQRHRHQLKVVCSSQPRLSLEIWFKCGWWSTQIFFLSLKLPGSEHCANNWNDDLQLCCVCRYRPAAEETDVNSQDWIGVVDGPCRFCSHGGTVQNAASTETPLWASLFTSPPQNWSSNAYVPGSSFHETI